MKLFNKLITAAALTSVIGIANAACAPGAYRDCAAAAERCVANGTNPAICEYRYEVCLSRKGCGPIP